MDVNTLPKIQVAPDDVELAARIAASRRTVVDFTSYTDPSYVAEPVHMIAPHTVVIAPPLDKHPNINVEYTEATA